jgi:hypothetical protein
MSAGTIDEGRPDDENRGRSMEPETIDEGRPMMEPRPPAWG